ncbi:hypothetical protein PoB_003964700 [Plakobranchus ocellatus]|uniref:Uncharacterized protein n=1 Tax=Plakobranchus ocellatus TaxID=259542 RepID=A0AAV4B213_9GAST|nr:hypothetical protein PoB_003964700 [Plakobranchus ocellatus]
MYADLIAGAQTGGRASKIGTTTYMQQLQPSRTAKVTAPSAKELRIGQIARTKEWYKRWKELYISSKPRITWQLVKKFVGKGVTMRVTPLENNGKVLTSDWKRLKTSTITLQRLVEYHAMCARQ